MTTLAPRAGETLQQTVAANRGKRIGILIVTYNALTTLRKVLERIPQDVWKNVEQVVVFDDASQDATYELAVGLKEVWGDTKLHVLKHEKNLGYGGNQKAGYRYFIEHGFDIAVLLHGDGQYAPELLAEMYRPIVAGEAEAVFGSRMMRDHGGPLKGGMPLYKYVGNRILTVFENWALGMKLTEFHSGYRAYSMHAMKQIDFTHMTNDFHFDTEIIIKFHHQGFRLNEIPIPTYYGDEICYVNGVKYAKDVFSAVKRYQETRRSVHKHPEFSEYFIHYPIKHSTHSSHFMVKEAVGANQSVLDVGCGKGFLAEQLVEQGNRVFGTDQLAPTEVSPSFEGYVQEDLESGLGASIGEFKDRRFDKIIFADVLEHMPRPEIHLRQALGLLAENGQLIVSVPNVVNITVRLAMLFGRFTYQERGILDRTHLRFYTAASARTLLEQEGYAITRQRMTVMPLEIVVPLALTNPLMKLMHAALVLATKLLPNLLGYQVFLVARRGANAPGSATIV